MGIATYILTAPLLFIAGWLTQRVGTCAVAAAAEIARDRRANRLAGFLLCATVAMMTMLLADRCGWPVFRQFHAGTVQPASLFGAILFAIGAHLNGRCSLGTLAELAQGRLRGAATIIGMVSGAFAGAAVLPLVLPITMHTATAPSPIAGWSTAVALAGAGGIAALLVMMLRHGLGRAPVARFGSPIALMAANGIIIGLLFVVVQRWPYSSLISDAARGMTAGIGMRIALSLILFAGAVSAAIRGGLFLWTPGTMRDRMAAFGAGTLMGFGALLVPGGNEALLFTGLPLLLPGPSIAYAVMLGTLVILSLYRSAIAKGAARTVSNIRTG